MNDNFEVDVSSSFGVIVGADTTLRLSLSASSYWYVMMAPKTKIPVEPHFNVTLLLIVSHTTGISTSDTLTLVVPDSMSMPLLGFVVSLLANRLILLIVAPLALIVRVQFLSERNLNQVSLFSSPSEFENVAL